MVDWLLFLRPVLLSITIEKSGQQNTQGVMEEAIVHITPHKLYILGPT